MSSWSCLEDSQPRIHSQFFEVPDVLDRSRKNKTNWGRSKLRFHVQVQDLREENQKDRIYKEIVVTLRMMHALTR
jgi:uncharacterized Ntn-hydrolase superfamily protein